MTDDLTQTAFRIADEAMDDAVTYLVQRGRAGRHCLPCGSMGEEVRHG